MLQIEQAARAHLGRQAASAGLVEPLIDVTLVPSARVLAPCARAVTVEPQDTRLPSRMRFVAVCPGAGGWRYDFVVRATVSAKVAVVRDPVAAGQPLEAAQLLRERRDISAVPDSIADPAAAAGMVSRRALRAGELLRTGMLAAPVLVKRGAAVRIVARREQIEVSMAGEALDAGAEGALVRVRNASSGNVIRARVIGPDTVQPVDLNTATHSPE